MHHIEALRDLGPQDLARLGVPGDGAAAETRLSRRRRDRGGPGDGRALFQVRRPEPESEGRGLLGSALRVAPAGGDGPGALRGRSAVLRAL